MLCQHLLICKALNDDLAIIKFALTKYDLQIGGSKKELLLMLFPYNFEVVKGFLNKTLKYKGVTFYKNHGKKGCFQTRLVSIQQNAVLHSI